MACAIAKVRWCGLLALWALAAPVLAAGCAAPTPSAQLDQVRSQWQEFNAQGQRLVDETGWLHGATLALAGDCTAWQWQAQWSHASGTRHYNGVSSVGAALQTRSQIQRNQLQLTGWLPMASTWALGTRLGWTQLDRDIASVGPVQGYPEHFRYADVAVGARFAVVEPNGTQWAVQAWLGGGPAGTLHLQLPRTDAANLRLGSSQKAQLGLTWERPASVLQGLSWHAGAQLQFERMRAGPSQALTRNGLLVGAAAQPQTRQTSAGLDVGLLYRF